MHRRKIQLARENWRRMGMVHWRKKIEFSSYIRKCRMEQLQSHIWLTASSYMGKFLRISSYIRKPFLIYDFATAPLRISLYMRKIWFSFLSVYMYNCNHGWVIQETEKWMFGYRWVMNMWIVGTARTNNIIQGWTLFKVVEAKFNANQYLHNFDPVRFRTRERDPGHEWIFKARRWVLVSLVLLSGQLKLFTPILGFSFFSTLQFCLQILLPFFTIMEPFMRTGQGEFLQQCIILYQTSW